MYSEPRVVPRRSRDELSRLEKRKLEEQGIHEDMCSKDLSIMKERYGLDKCHTIVGTLSGEKTTCEEAKRRITELMSTTNKEGGMYTCNRQAIIL